MTVDGRYVLKAAIGHGGMGTVWRATDTLLRRDVAVKEVAPPPGVSAAERDAMYQRMMREARAAAMISHPSVVKVYDAVTDGGRPWIVMELLDARSLADIVVEDGPLAPRAVAKIGVAMLGALEMAHAAGVLHRDVKPANVLICHDGRPVLTDFGVARMPSDQQLTTPGMVLGSPHFISPERAMGAPFGPSSDLFSLGVTLYAAVEGRPPFDKGDPIATMHSVVEDPPRPPERAGVLTEVLYGLLEKDPNRRWDAPTARQALRDLLAGPLASTAPHFPTDPYSVVPSHLPTYQAAPPPSTSRVGGRAMLPPDSPLGGPVPTAVAGHGAPAPVEPAHVDQPTAGYDVGAESWQPSPHPTPGRRAQGAETSPLAVAGATAARVVTRVRETVRTLPRSVVVAAAAGLTAVVLVGSLILAFRSGDDEPGLSAGQQPAGEPTPAPDDAPALEVQQYADRGISVNLPAHWEQTETTEIRVDFGDPASPSTRRLRLLFEASGADARRFVENVAENGIRNNCPEPYERVDLHDFELAGLPATQLEYTCGTGQDARHALWATVVRDGVAYSFFVTMPPDQFEECRTIFDELVRSFQFTG